MIRNKRAFLAELLAKLLGPRSQNTGGRREAMALKSCSAWVQKRFSMQWSLGGLLVLLLAAPLSGQIVTPPTPATPAQETTTVYIVRFRAGTPASEKAAIVQGAGAVLRRTFSATNSVSVQVPNDAALAGLRNNPRVEGVFPSRLFTLNAPQGRGGNGGGGSGGGGSGGGGGGGKPKPPANLSAAATSASGIALSWNDASNNEDGFAVERCEVLACSFAEVAQVAANATSYNDSGLSPSTTYRYRVAAFSAAGSSKYSNTAEATTQSGPPPPPPPPPAAPSNLTAQAVSTSQINLSWSDNSTDEDGFRIERCQGPMAGCSPFAQIAQVGPDTASYSNTGLASETTYSYRVVAYNGAGDSGYSNTMEETTQSPPPPPPPPSAPSGLSATAVSSTQINLSWSDNSNNEDGFSLERCQGLVETCVSFAPIAQLAANATSYSNTGLAPNTTYAYRVRAYNGSGNSAYSTAVDATTLSGSSTQVIPEGVQRIGAAPGTLSATGAGVGVAIVDTGLNFSHPDLGMAAEVIGVNSYNAVDPAATCEDIHGHGTHVGGIVAARNNTIDVVGVAPDATLYCVNVFQPDPIYEVVATDESLIAGLEWIAANATELNPPIRAVNMSLGREKTPEDTPNHPLHLAVKALYDMGISVVVSAGNDSSLEVFTQVPASYAEVMAVGSTTAVDGVNGYDDFFIPCAGEQNILADTASYFTTDGLFAGGTGVTISAPGESREDIFEYLGTCFVQDIGILSTWPGPEGETIELSGTSMAAPHVAGVVALIWEAIPGLSPEDIRTRLRNNVDRWGTAPLDSEVEGYSFDGEREGILWAPAAIGDEPPPPPDSPPTVSLDSPANGAAFEVGEIINFAGTASDLEDGDLSGSLVWTSDRDGPIGAGSSFANTLSGGNHTITATVTDSGGNVVRESVDITVGSSGESTSVSVTSITYFSQGPDLVVDVALRDEFGAPVAGAVVSANIFQIFYGYDVWSLVETTNAQGVARFRVVNAPLDGYSTTVTAVDAPGMTWDGVTPFNWSWH